MTRVGELVTLASSIAASSGSLTGVAVRYPSGSLDLSEESMTRVGSAVSTIPADRVTVGLASLGMLTMFFEVLRLILCHLGVGSGILLRGNSDSLIISLL